MTNLSSPNPYGFIDPESFDWRGYIASGGLLGKELGPDKARVLMSAPEGRRELTKLDPLLFALVYLRPFISGKDGEVYLAGFHLETFGWARNTLALGIKDEKRLGFVAPRGAGKSTLLFLVIPLWAMAHRHQAVITAYADASQQAENHLANLRRQIAENDLLRKDHSGFVTPVIDRQDLFLSKTGSAFSAKGIDRATRGFNVNGNRPSWIIFDDIEPGESNYSDSAVEKRRHSVLTDVMGGDPDAVVSFVGTVTRADSMIHDILKTQTESNPPTWVTDEGIKCRYYPALVTLPDGTKRSMWENGPGGHWRTEHMLKVEHTLAFQAEHMNNPRGKEGKYWSLTDFEVDSLKPYQISDRWILQVDPAVTTRDSSDWTGLAVVCYRPPREDSEDKRPVSPTGIRGDNRPVVEVVKAYGVKLANEDLRREVLKLLEEFPAIKYVRVEVNQGGELWAGAVDANGKPVNRSAGVLHDLPPGVEARVMTTRQNKEAKFAKAHGYYQHPSYRILHRPGLGDLEQQMISFPKGRFDDIADAAVMGILYFVEKPTKKKVAVGMSSSTYI